MPRKAKKTPAPKKGSRKGSKKTTDLDGSISQTLGDSVSTSLLDDHLPRPAVLNSGLSAEAGPSATSPAVLQPPRDKSNAILAYLERLDQSNQALTKRVSELETNRSVASTLIMRGLVQYFLRGQLTCHIPSHIHSSRWRAVTQLMQWPADLTSMLCQPNPRTLCFQLLQWFHNHHTRAYCSLRPHPHKPNSVLMRSYPA